MLYNRGEKNRETQGISSCNGLFPMIRARYHTVRTSATQADKMRVLELARYNIPEKIIDSWISQVGENLLPVQERAIKRYGILEGKSLLISSPTTSGKTFDGKIAAVKGVMEKKKVIYLVPLKSLAEEKYLDFKEKYQEFGIKGKDNHLCELRVKPEAK